MNRLEISTLKCAIRGVKGTLTLIDKKLDIESLKKDDALVSDAQSFVTILCKSWLEYSAKKEQTT